MRSLIGMRLVWSVAWMVLCLLQASEARGDVSALAQLERNARAWEAKGREDKAVEAWTRVLRSNPNHADALAAVSIHASRVGQPQEAEARLRQLEANHPNHETLGVVRQALAIGIRHGALLSLAREHARAGRLHEAVATYRELFGAHPPTDALAVEVYQTVAASIGGWEEARRGLEAAARRMPFPRPRVALAMHLTYRESTRREGIQRLQALVDEPEVAETARASWKQALGWLQVAASDAPLFDAYRERYPQDDTTWKLRPRPSRDIRSKSLARGFEALDRSDVDAAEKIFDRAKGDAEAWVGLGLVAMQREEFPKAREIFERVKRLVPKRRELWESSLRSATFWSLVKEAEAAREKRDIPQARARLEAAIAVSADEADHAKLVVASLDLDEEKFSDAEPRLAALCAGGRVRREACSLLAEVLARMDRLQEARAVNELLEEIAPDRAHRDGYLAAEALRFGASRAIEAGFHEEARAMLIEARRWDPQNLWTLLSLAGLHATLGEVLEARMLLEALAILAPDLPEARIVEARILILEERYGSALEVLDSLPSRAFTPSLLEERDRLEIQAEIEGVRRQHASGARASARQALLRLQWKTEGKPEGAVLIAKAWSDLGEGERASAMMTETLAKTKEPTISLRLEAVSVYLASGKTEEIPRLLREIGDQAGLSPSERRWLQGLRVGYGVYRADRLREEGDLLRAFSHLRPLLQEFPQEPSLLAALGRLFRKDGQLQQAHVVFLSALREEPGHHDARQGALETSAELKKTDEVQRLAAEGIQQAPESARMHFVAGRALIAVGETAAGMRALESAQRLLDERAWRDQAVLPVSVGGGTQETLLHAARRFRESEKELFAAQGTEALGLEIQAEILRVRGDMGMHVQGGGFARHRSGEEGLGSLTELRAPIETGTSIGYRGRLMLEVVPTLLDAGTMDPSDVGRATRLGWGEFTFPREGGSHPQQASGVGLALAFATDALRADVGSTPFGFPIQTMVGGFEWTSSWEALHLTFGAERRAITDSLLSYAGWTDPEGERAFGGVTRNGAKLNLAFIEHSAVYYLHGGYDYLIGEGVAENHRGSFGLGVEWRLLQERRSSFSSGLDIGGMLHDKNLRYFTHGHGGYFSPQAFVHLGVPFRWQGENDRFGWNLSADVGVNWFQEEDALIFPLDPAQQRRFEEIPHPETGMGFASVYPGQTVVSFAVNASPRLYLRLTDRLHGGIVLDVHSALDYTELTGGIFLRSTFAGSVRKLGPQVSGWGG